MTEVISMLGNWNNLYVKWLSWLFSIDVRIHDGQGNFLKKFCVGAYRTRELEIIIIIKMRQHFYVVISGNKYYVTIYKQKQTHM